MLRVSICPRLAERFYRVEGQKSGQKLGTGLGLAIVKHIMNRHRVRHGGGKRSRRHGTTFIAYVPIFRRARRCVTAPSQVNGRPRNKTVA